jgi:ABC-type Mn2+/Zn2+ transport system ATPase subunit
VSRPLGDGNLHDHRVLLRAEGVCVGYGRGDVLTNVSLAVRCGEVTALVGVNGSGKTTFLRVALGLIRPRVGALVHLADRRPRVGYVPQADASEVLFPVTAQEVVLMGLTPSLGLLARAGSTGRSTAAAALERFGVGDLGPRRFRDLSGGQRQRVLLARALVGRPELLVLDEPVRGLDFTSAAALVAIITRLATEHDLAVIVATHNLDLVANHAATVALFKDGRVKAGPVGEIFNDELLSEYHGAPVHVDRVAGHRVVVPGELL